MQPFPEADDISRTFQADFDRMLFDALEKYNSHPGFSLLLGSILQYRNIKYRFSKYPPGLVASLHLIRQQGEGHILEDTGFSGIAGINSERPGNSAFLSYFIELLENPERSGTLAFDEQKYATAAQECLQLCLCSHHKFSKGATESTHSDKVLLRNKPWAWRTRLGVHSRIRKAMRSLTIRQRKFLKARSYNIYQYASSPQGSFEHEYYRSLVYQWRLDLLPICLEKSGISLELADVLRSRTFTTMAQIFPRRIKLARESIATYLLRVDVSAVGGP